MDILPACAQRIINSNSANFDRMANCYFLAADEAFELKAHLSLTKSLFNNKKNSITNIRYMISAQFHFP